MAKQILGKVVPIAKGEYNSSTQYEILDIVTHNGSSYIAKTNVKGQTPTNTTYWQLLAKVGDKPVYGVDYLTEQEMDAIVQDIINDSTNTFNQNVTAKTNEFNTNATSKTNAFNQNAENKTTTFNNNASTKTSTFNTNASDITADFNSNATAKTTAFDTNAQNKTNDFNTNATSSTDDFDRNAAAKTTTFNNNATAKQDTYDENHTSKLGEYNTNATAKTTAFNENYQEKLDDFNSHVEDYDKRITTNSNRIQHIETDLFDSGNATGSSITLNDSTLAEFIDIKEDGVCEQTTTSIADGDEYDSPSPEHPQPITVLEGSHNIVVTEKNLFDTSLLPITKNGVTISKNNNGDIVINGTPDINSGYINFQVGKVGKSEAGTYTSSVINKRLGVGIVTGMGSGNINIAMSDTVQSRTFNFPSSYSITPQVNISYDAGTFNNFVLNPQLEKSLTVTTYEPFVGTTTEITIPTGQFAAKINDTYKDQIRIAYNEDDGEYHAYLDKKVGKVVLDGSENWGNTSAPSNTTHLFRSYIGNDVLIPLLSDYYIYVVSNIAWSSDNKCITFNTNDGYILIRDAFENTNDLKTWLSTHNVTVYLPLATPTTIDLGVIDMPTTYYPITNVFTDSELNPVLEVNYYRDFKTTIQTMQNNITTLQSNYLSLDQRVTALENTNTQSNVASVESEGE